MSSPARNVLAGALVVPAAGCVWCGRSFGARDAFEEVPSSGDRPYYAHRGTGRVGDPDCAGEIEAVRGMRETEAAAEWADLTALPFDVAA